MTTAACFLIGMIVLPLLNGFVISTAWGWILVPLFHLPALSISAAWGLSIVAGFFQVPPATQVKKGADWDHLVLYGYILAIIRVAIGLPLAWVAKTIMGWPA